MMTERTRIATGCATTPLAIRAGRHAGGLPGLGTPKPSVRRAVLIQKSPCPVPAPAQQTYARARLSCGYCCAGRRHGALQQIRSRLTRRGVSREAAHGRRRRCSCVQPLAWASAHCCNRRHLAYVAFLACVAGLLLRVATRTALVGKGPCAGAPLLHRCPAARLGVMTWRSHSRGARLPLPSERRSCTLRSSSQHRARYFACPAPPAARGHVHPVHRARPLPSGAARQRAAAGGALRLPLPSRRVRSVIC